MDSTLPKNISPTDPAARWTAVRGGPAFYAHSTNYLIDLDAGITVDVEPTPAHRTEEVEATRTMIERVERQFDLTPKRLVADTAYGAAPMLNWIVNEKNIEPQIPVWEKSLREDGTFSPPDFRFDARANRYECPGGKKLTSTATQRTRGLFSSELRSMSAAVARSSSSAAPTPRIARSPGASARTRVMSHVLYVPHRRMSGHTKQRKKVEMLFAHLKRILKLDRLGLRGISGARDEFFLMAAAAQNLRRMARWLTPATV